MNIVFGIYIESILVYVLQPAYEDMLRKGEHIVDGYPIGVAKAIVWQLDHKHGLKTGIKMERSEPEKDKYIIVMKTVS